MLVWSAFFLYGKRTDRLVGYMLVLCLCRLQGRLQIKFHFKKDFRGFVFYIICIKDILIVTLNIYLFSKILFCILFCNYFLSKSMLYLYLIYLYLFHWNVSRSNVDRWKSSKINNLNTIDSKKKVRCKIKFNLQMHVTRYEKYFFLFSFQN